MNPRVIRLAWKSGVVLLIVLSSCCTVLACTSFAVYSDRPFYGMNFDYDPSVEMKFCIDTIGEVKVFDMRFDIGGSYASTVAVNSNGLFCNLQELCPEVPPQYADSGDMSIVELFVASANTFASCQDVRSVMSDHRIIMGSISLHSLYADTTGDAMVVEVGQDGNIMTAMDGSFIVMTNFPVHEFADRTYQEVSGAGGDRYKAAYAYLLEHADSFDVDDGFALLSRAVNQSTTYPTRCSMVFDPENSDIYIALEGSFEKMWKVSLEHETVETFKGFDGHAVIDIGEGVTASQLKTLQPERVDESDADTWMFMLVGVIIVGILVGAWIRKRNKLLKELAGIDKGKPPFKRDKGDRY